MKKKKLRIKTGNPVWWTFMALLPLSILLIYLIVGRNNRENAMHFMKGLSIFMVIFYFTYKGSLSLDKNFKFNIFNEFPFQLCNMTTIFMLFAILLDNSLLQCFCFVFGSFGPLVALFMPDVYFVDIPIFSIRGIGYFGYHGMLVVASISLVTLGIYHPDYSCLWSMAIMLLCLIFLIHGINVAFRKWGLNDRCNYMYTFGLPTNPILNKAKQLIPINAVYEIPLIPLGIAVAVVMIFIARLFL